eukprot:m.24307 g.24307  ORF g.24307 m.24307 type:complete len:217 (-) comp7451_c0_seq1:324-974(-)
MADDVGCVPQHVVMRAKMACNLALDALEVWQATSAAGLSVANKLCNSELKQSHVMASDERERFELSLASQELLRRFQWDGVGDTEVLTRLCSSLTQSLAKLCAVHTTLDAMRQDLDVALWRLPVLSTCSLNRLVDAVAGVMAACRRDMVIKALVANEVTAPFATVGGPGLTAFDGDVSTIGGRRDRQLVYLSAWMHEPFYDDTAREHESVLRLCAA